MPMRCEVGFLRPDDAARAFAIMQVVVPGMDFATWRRLSAAEPRGRGWAVARDERGYIRGLCRMQPATQSSMGHLLDVPIFATLSVFDEECVSRELFDFARRYAWEEGYAAIRLWDAGPLSSKQLEMSGPDGEPPHAMLYDLTSDSSRSRH